MRRIFSKARPEYPDLCRRCQQKVSIPLQAGSWEIHLGSSYQIFVFSGDEGNCLFCRLLVKALGIAETTRPGSVFLRSYVPPEGSKLVGKGYLFEARLEYGVNSSSPKHSRWAILKMTPLSGADGLTAKETLPNPDSPEAFNQVQSWLSTCLSEHSCLSSGSVPLPTRVIHLNGPNLANLRLHVPPPGSLGEYAALSYCWGSSPPFTTSSANLEERMRGFRLSELPATICDAVRVARALGMKYLWVDALCIIQGTDEQAVADWKRESAHMEDVYGNAHVTIVAAASRHCNAGMLNVRSCVVPIKSKTVDASEGLVAIMASRQIPDFKEEPINKRAWCLQERLLSPRIITYASQEISWQCDGGVFGDNPTDFTPDEIGKRYTPTSWHRIYRYRLPKSPQPPPEWRIIVQNYYSRDLTNPRDKLPALSGVAKQYHQATGDRYLAGLWESSLVTDLLWIQDETFETFYSRASSSMPSAYRAPSWSWAAVNGVVSFSPAFGMKAQDRGTVTITHCSIDAVNPEDPYGMVFGGRLSLSGPFKQAARVGWDQELSPGVPPRHIEKPTPAIYALDDKDRDEFKVANAWLDGDDRTVVARAKEVGEVYCLVVTTKGYYFGFVLLPTSERRETFVRIGVFVAYDLAKQMPWFDNTRAREITIV